MSLNDSHQVRFENVMRLLKIGKSDDYIIEYLRQQKDFNEIITRHQLKFLRDYKLKISNNIVESKST